MTAPTCSVCGTRIDLIHSASGIFDHTAALPTAGPDQPDALREALLRGIDAHGFIDYPTPRCDCEEWPAKGDPDKYHDDHLATVLAAALATSAAAGEGDAE